ncbi:MAG: hypothetical protein ACTSP4_14840 [Candidatus Hodarchaeales archaeon]
MNMRIILASLIFLTFIVSQPITDVILVSAGPADGVQTSLTAWFSRPFYPEAGTVTVEVSIWDSDLQGVSTGNITIKDLNSSIDFTVPVNDQITVASWTDTEESTGVHLINISYEDPSRFYTPVSGIYQILIGSSEKGDHPVQLLLDEDVFSVTKGQVITISGSLSRADSTWFFINEQLAYMAIIGDIAGEEKYLSVIYPTVGLTRSMAFSIDVVIPPWVDHGPIPSICSFSGYISQLLDYFNRSFTINVIPSAKTLIMQSNSSVVERNNITETHGIELTLQIAGYEGEKLRFDLKQYTAGGAYIKDIIENLTINSYTTVIPLSFDSDYLIGTFNLTGTISDFFTGEPISSYSIFIDVIDDLIVDNFYWNLSSNVVEIGQMVEGFLFGREEDNYIARPSELMINDISAGISLFNGSSLPSGQCYFNFTIPDDYAAGVHELEFTLNPQDSFLRESSLKKVISLMEETVIYHDEETMMIRGDSYTFNATVLDGSSNPVTDGVLSLYYGEQLLHESPASSSAKFQFTVPVDFDTGTSFFSWKYSGSEYYGPSTLEFPVYSSI